MVFYVYLPEDVCRHVEEVAAGKTLCGAAELDQADGAAIVIAHLSGRRVGEAASRAQGKM